MNTMVAIDSTLALDASKTMRQRRGAHAQIAGLNAETLVARHYRDLGYTLVDTRWRGRAGEIDLVCRHGDSFVFVEVKSSRNFSKAAHSLRPAQMARIARASQEYIGTCPRGLLTPMRIDVALVDTQGQIERIENALQMFC